MHSFCSGKQNIFTGLITSKTRVRILMRLFLNSANRAYLRELAAEFGASPSQVRDELQQLSDAGLLTSEREGRQIFYRANDRHALFPELNSMVRKALGMDRILDSIVRRLGPVEEVALVDDYAQGKDTGLIDLVFLGDIDQESLADLTRKTEHYLERKIRNLVFASAEETEYRALLADRPCLCLWRQNEDDRRASAAGPTQ